MRIATWNVNSVRARLPLLVDWLRQAQPDVLCMQETKVEDAAFPREAIEDQGYNLALFGERTYNGVALAARFPIENVERGWPGDDQCRVISACIGDMIVIDVYVPNGQSLGSDKYQQKLAWLERFAEFVAARYDPAEKVVVTGDFNITFDDRDVWDPVGMRESIHCSSPERRALARVMAVGLVDGLRHFHEQPAIYTWWDHRAGALQRNQGMRIDHFLLSPRALDACTDISVDVAVRHARATSDHAPVIATFAKGA